MAEWPASKLEDVSDDITVGFVGSMSPLFVEQGVPLLRGQNIQPGRLDLTNLKYVSRETHQKWKKSSLSAGDVVIVRVGFPGTACVIPPGMGELNAASLVIVRPEKQKLDSRFLCYFLNSPAGQQTIHSRLVGSVQQVFNTGTAASLEILVPSLAEQKAIAAMLGALDDKIELNRQMNATLEAMAGTLFQSWFVDFDPVRAKLDGRQPTGLDPATAAFFPNHFEHTENGLLPLGWRRTAIEEVCAINASTLNKNDKLETLEYIEIAEVSRGNIANIATYARGDEPSRARRRLRHGDTALSTVRPDRGSYFLALNPPKNRFASTGFAVITPTKAPWSFVHAAMTQPEVSEYLGQMADGGAYPAVRPEVIEAIKIALPNEQRILEAFHSICGPLFEQAEANRVQSRMLAIMRDTLLPKLLSGEVNVVPRPK